MNLLKLAIKSTRLSLASGVLFALASAGFANSSKAQSVSYICTQDNQNTPTTYIQLQDGQIPLFTWKSQYFSQSIGEKGAWTPQRRCEHVSDKLNIFQAQGILKEFHGGKSVKTGQSIICASACRNDDTNIILTVLPNQTPKQVIDQLVAHQYGRTNESIEQNTGKLKPKESNGAIFNLEDYIKNAPVERKAVSTNQSPNSTTKISPQTQVERSPVNTNTGSKTPRWGN